MSFFRRHLIMTDYDGTLSEIVLDPARALPHPKALPTLRALWQEGHEVYVVSGRSRHDLQRRLDFLPDRLIGLHGLEWPNEYMNSAWLEEARDIRAALPQETGLVVEDKRYTVAVHYRGVAPDHMHKVVTLLEQVPLPKTWEMIRGKCVREYRPKGVGKDSAVHRLMARHADLPALFIGDDVTDEAAFRAVQERGGTGIKVGNGPTAARSRVGSVTEAVRFLSQYCRTSPSSSLNVNGRGGPDSAPA